LIANFFVLVIETNLTMINPPPKIKTILPCKIYSLTAVW